MTHTFPGVCIHSTELSPRKARSLYRKVKDRLKGPPAFPGLLGLMRMYHLL